MSGGQWIHFQNYSNCTIAWSHIRNAEGAGGYYSLTAGHCAPSGTKAFRGRNGTSVQMGAMGSQNPVGPGVHIKCDCKQFGQIPTGGYRSNTIHRPQNQKLELTGTATATAYSNLCHSGAASAEFYGTVLCGDVVARNASYQEYNPGEGYYFTLDDAVRVDVDVEGGDSGGPVFDVGKLYGVISGEQVTGEDVSMIYSQTRNVQPVAGVTIKFGAF